MTQQETPGHVEVNACSPLQNPHVQGRLGPSLCQGFLIVRPAPGESAALATLRPYERREAQGEFAAPGREGAAALWADGPPLTPHSLWPVPGSVGICVHDLLRIAHIGWVRGAGEDALGHD